MTELAKIVTSAGNLRIDWFDQGGGASTASGSRSAEASDSGGDKGSSPKDSSSGVGEKLWDAFSPLFDLIPTSPPKARPFEDLFEFLAVVGEADGGKTSVWHGLGLFRSLAGLGKGGKEDSGNANAKELWEAFGPLAGAGVDGIIDTLMPEGFSNPLTWPTVKTGLGLLKWGIGLGVKGAKAGEGGGLLPDGRLGPGGLNPIAREDTAVPPGAGVGTLASSLMGGLGAAGIFGGLGGFSVSNNFYGQVDGPKGVENNIQKANLVTIRRMTTAGALA